MSALVDIAIPVGADRAETLSDALLEAGAVSVSIEDADAGSAAEVGRFAEPGADAPLWDRCVVRALLPAACDAHALVLEACHAAEVALPAELVCTPVPDDDWVQRTRDQFQPIHIHDRLWIVPTWHDPVDASALNIRLDPGQAFGTGAHPTTRLCLRWLVENVTAGAQVLDYGCGSGILAIAAARLGAGRTIGVDIDRAALEAAALNAARNEVTVELRDAAREVPERFDLVVANILAGPLSALAPLLAASTRPGGRIALAGILTRQADAVAAVYGEWFTMAHYGIEEDWVCLCGTRTR